ncbi:MAG: ribosome biogenesis GTPase Der [Acidimicrobiales bacterium]
MATTPSSKLAAPPVRRDERLPPFVVIAGRPNVGKSTLVNRFVGSRRAIVEERPGVTRDRLELDASWNGRDFRVVDTGGIGTSTGGIDGKVRSVALDAIGRADLVLLVVDATTGVTTEDADVAEALLRSGTRAVVVVNKVDAASHEQDVWPFLRFGLGDPVAVSALHGRGVGDLLDLVVARLDEAIPRGDDVSTNAGDEPDGKRDAREDEEEIAASVAIVGRPNVGKSTLFNRLVGEERSVVHDVPGTTRDAVDTLVDTSEGRIRFVDTAGLRRKSRIGEGTEYYSLVRSLSAIDSSDVALLVLDAREGVSHQDQRIAERIDAAGSPIVVVLNKWDLLTTEQRLEAARDVRDKLGFLDWAPVLRVSAKSGQGVHRILPSLKEAIAAYHRRIPTAALNAAIGELQQNHPAPGAHISYAVQGAIEPPTITLFSNRRLDPGYLRYVERILRQRFALGPTALKLRVRLRSR